jgi:hypothetical protein
MTRPGALLAATLLAAGLSGLPGAPAANAQSAGGGQALRAEFWADLRPVAGVGEEWPVSEASARARILDEAAWVYGGMIWGFEFRYTPYDKTRAIPESFELEPIGSLAPGALSFAPGTPLATSAARALPADELRAYVEYEPGASLAALMASYALEPWKGCQGLGKADMDLGVKGRRAAYEDGLRLALRSLLQGLEPNKPRLVRGRVVLDRPPSMAIIGGYYTARIRARAMVTEAIPYKIY